MGSAQSAGDQASSTASKVSDSVSHAADAVSNAPEQVQRATAGSPLIAGAVAFGIGALVARCSPGPNLHRRPHAPAARAFWSVRSASRSVSSIYNQLKNMAVHRSDARGVGADLRDLQNVPADPGPVPARPLGSSSASRWRCTSASWRRRSTRPRARRCTGSR